MEQKRLNVLVTGGAGYIGAHSCLALLKAGYEVIVLDNLSNGNYEAVKRVEKLTGKTMTFYEDDLIDLQKVTEIFESHQIGACIHFAGLKSVSESCMQPLKYFFNNITGTLNLLKAMEAKNVNKLVFSSSATVYGNPRSVPVNEDSPLHATNPYGETKLMLEDILRSVCNADKNLNVAILRYFNPVGADDSGLIGEDPAGIPNNLMPYISHVAIGRQKRVGIFGNDYPTRDGTGIRDYIHITDLARGHLLAMEKLNESPGLVTYNLGTGKGYSVLEMIAAFSNACRKEIKTEVFPRRDGDVAQCYADTSKAERELGFAAERGIDKMCEDAWRWQQMNPNGYIVR